MPSHLGYSRESLEAELTALDNAHHIISDQLRVIGNASFETFLTVFNADIHVIKNFLEVRQILKGVCDLCGYTPCECPESDEVDTVPFDLMRHLGLPQ